MWSELRSCLKRLQCWMVHCVGLCSFCRSTRSSKMAGRLCVAFALYLLGSCHGVELSLDRQPPAVSGARALCAVLTCEQTIDPAVSTTTDNDQADSMAVFKSVSSMAIFRRASTGPSGNAGGKRDVLIGSVSPQSPSLTRVANGRQLHGLLDTGRATLRVEMVKQDDCAAEFTCQVRGVDAKGREVVTSTSLVQQSAHTADQADGSSLEPAMSLQLSASLQQMITQLHKDLSDRSNSFENRMEDKILNLQKDFGDRIDYFERHLDNKFDNFENRIEDKIDNNNNLNKLIQLDFKVSTELAQFRTEAKSELLNTLDTMTETFHSEQTEALRNISESLEKTVNTTSELRYSMESYFHSRKSHDQNCLATVKNETEKIRGILMSGEINATCHVNNETEKIRGILMSGEINATSLVNDTVDSHQAISCYSGMGNDTNRSYPSHITSFDDTLGRDILCDTKTAGGGWIVIQRRVSGDVDFFRNWTEYRSGFGDLTGDFWLGNDAINELTNRHPFELRIDMRIKDQDVFAHYASFKMEAESDNYRLRLGPYSGTVGEEPNGGLSYSNNQQFTTFDKDNDVHWGRNCASRKQGAWWYGRCSLSNLNGLWGVQDHTGVAWKTERGWEYTTYTEMKIRRI